MKNKTWVILIIVLAILIAALFLKNRIRLLFLPEGGPSDCPVESVVK